MAYNQKNKAGRGNMPKTGRGIPSSILSNSSSPLAAKNFPVKPGMKLADYEAVIDTRTGEIVDSSAVTNAAPGTDLSYLEGVTNLSALAGDTANTPQEFDNSFEGRANIQQRITGPSNVNYGEYVGFYPEVNEPAQDLTTGDVNMSRLPRSKKMQNRITQTQDQIQKLIQQRNLDRAKVALEGGTTPDVANRTVTQSGEPIYTTARVTGYRDQAMIPDVNYSLGAYRRNGFDLQDSNLTQFNLNYPGAFSQKQIKERISQNPEAFYREGEIGGTGFNPAHGKNIRSQYSHSDFSGRLQAPKTPRTRRQLREEMRREGFTGSERDYRGRIDFN